MDTTKNNKEEHLIRDNVKECIYQDVMDIVLE